MIIKHLTHSGFIIEEELFQIVFDPITPIDISKKTYIFISHSHHDHFNKDILPLMNGDMEIFISNDVDLPSSNKIHKLYPYEKLQIGDLVVYTYGSTDLGNSYLVISHGKSYFHSGDLNWWHWDHMNSKELLHEEKIYKDEIRKLEAKIIDYAFIPVDPRLKDKAYLAINYFIQEVNPTFVIPMHSFGDYNFYNDLYEKVELKNTTLINVSNENKTIYTI